MGPGMQVGLEYTFFSIEKQDWLIKWISMVSITLLDGIKYIVKLIDWLVKLIVSNGKKLHVYFIYVFQCSVGPHCNLRLTCCEYLKDYYY